jgi:3-dehydroquinate synthase
MENDMEVLKITAGESEYDVLIAGALMQSIPERLKADYPKSRFAVISDNNVWGLYGGQFAAGLDALGLRHDVITVPPGERSKSMETYAEILGRLARLGYTRSDVIVAFGGGVVGDVTGFAAATYLRGVRYIQIPTTLLAQIDSSVGGKTAVNLPEGKNLAGAFYQPSVVYIDTGLLKTLSPEDFADGMAEMIKYALIRDKAMIETLKDNIITASSPELEELIKRCLEIKRDVVAADERDKGERMILNFGHTIGHALERICSRSGAHITHGQAVSRGMAAITSASERMDQTKQGTSYLIEKLLQSAALPCGLDGFDSREILEGIFVDKKNIGEKLNIILLGEPGACFIHPISKESMAQYLYKEENI